VRGGAFGPILHPVVSAATAAAKLASAFAVLTDLESRRKLLEQRSWETDEGEHCSKVEMTADEIGVSPAFRHCRCPSS
jgi:hypothetical protein